MLGQRFHRGIIRTAVGNPVIEPTQHRRGVRDRFMHPQMTRGRTKIGDMRALAVRGNLERRPCPRRGLLKHQRDRPTGQQAMRAGPR